MKILESAENYLESILILRNEKGRVRSIDIVNHLGFSKPSVSIAMKQLEENGYITRDEDGHIFLTDAGKKIAKETYERHVFLTDLFVRCGVSEETAREGMPARSNTTSATRPLNVSKNAWQIFSI